MISPWVYHPTTKAVHTSISGCQRAIGLRGYVSISLQWSRPRLSASFPTLHTPMTSLCPTLKVQKWQLMEAGAWAKMLQEKKTTRVLTDHSPWRRWAGWSGQCSLEERRKRWPRCTRGSECCALSTSFSSSASGLRTSGTPSRMDLLKETWCDHPGIIRKVFFFSLMVSFLHCIFRTHLKLLWCPLLWDFLLWSWWWWACQPWADNTARTSAPQGPRSPEIHKWNTV